MRSDEVKVWVYQTPSGSHSEEQGVSDDFLISLQHPIEKLALLDLIASDLSRSPAFARSLNEAVVNWLADEVWNVDWGMQCAVILFNAAVNENLLSAAAIKTLAQIYQVLDPRDVRLDLIFHTLVTCLVRYEWTFGSEFFANFQVRAIHEALYLNFSISVYIRTPFKFRARYLAFLRYSALQGHSHLAMLALLEQPESLRTADFLRYFQQDDFSDPAIFSKVALIASKREDRNLICAQVHDYLLSLSSEALVSPKSLLLLEIFPPEVRSAFEARAVEVVDLDRLVKYVARNPRLLTASMLRRFLAGASPLMKLPEVIAVASLGLLKEDLLVSHLENFLVGSARYEVLVRAIQFKSVVEKHLILLVGEIVQLASTDQFVTTCVFLVNKLVESEGQSGHSLKTLAPRLGELAAFSAGAAYALAMLKVFSVNHVVTISDSVRLTPLHAYLLAWIRQSDGEMTKLDALVVEELVVAKLNEFDVIWTSDPLSLLQELRLYRCLETGRRAMTRPPEIARSSFTFFHQSCSSRVFWSIAAAMTQWSSVHTKLFTSDFVSVANVADSADATSELIETLAPLISQSGEKLLGFAPLLIERFVACVLRESRRGNDRLWGVLLPRVISGLLTLYLVSTSQALKSHLTELVSLVLSSSAASTKLRVQTLRLITGVEGFQESVAPVMSNLPSCSARLVQGVVEFLLRRDVTELQSFHGLPRLVLKALASAKELGVRLVLSRLYAKLITCDPSGCRVALDSAFAEFIDFSSRAADTGTREIVEDLLQRFSLAPDALYSEDFTELMRSGDSSEINESVLLFLARRSQSPSAIEHIFESVLSMAASANLLNSVTSVALWHAHLQKQTPDHFRLINRLVSRIELERSLLSQAALADGLFRVVIGLCEQEARKELLGLLFLLAEERLRAGMVSDDSQILRVALNCEEPVRSSLLSSVRKVDSDAGVILVIRHANTQPLVRHIFVKSFLSDEAERNRLLDSLAFSVALSDLSQDALLSDNRGLNILGLLLVLRVERSRVTALPDRLRRSAESDNLLSRLLLMVDATGNHESALSVDVPSSVDAGALRAILALSATFPTHLVSVVKRVRDAVADKLMLRFYLAATQDSSTEFREDLLTIACRAIGLPEVESSVLGYLAMARLLRSALAEDSWLTIRSHFSNSTEFAEIVKLSLMIPSGAVRRSCLVFLGLMAVQSECEMDKLFTQEAAEECLRGDERTRLLTLVVLGKVAERMSISEGRLLHAVGECLEDARLRVHAAYVLYKSGGVWSGTRDLRYSIKATKSLEAIAATRLCFMSQLVRQPRGLENAEFFSLVCIHTAAPVQDGVPFVEYLVDRRLKNLCAWQLIRSLTAVPESDLVKADALGAQEALHAATRDAMDETLKRKACLLLSQVAIAASRASMKRSKPAK